MSLIVDEHREYLSDAVRLEAFRRAAHECVRANDVVVDLGAGTGVLGLLACEVGASRVYAVESTGIIEIARRVARANGVADRVVHIQRHSSDVSLPEAADGIICDQIGHFGFEAGLFELLNDARRFLKPSGWIVPGALAMEIAAVEQPETRSRIGFWNARIEGLDFSPAREWAANTGYPLYVDPRDLLGPSVAVWRGHTHALTTERIVAEVTLPIERGGALDGIAGWFRAALSPSVELTNAPGAQPRLGRRNVVLPIWPPVDVRCGDRVELVLQIRPADLLVGWRGTVMTKAGSVSFDRSTLRGMLLTADELRRLDPAARPTLTPRGVARLTVLELCDGDRPLAEIENEVFRRHPALFKVPAEASAFVAEVISRYTE